MFMYYLGYICLLIAMFSAVGAAVLAIAMLWDGKSGARAFVEKAHILTTLALFIASACLLHALFWQDYSLQYAAHYTDKHLSLFYRLTAFWAGQPGSMLFWALAVSIFASIFAFSKKYAHLEQQTRLWFWLFQHTILVFFLLLLTVYSNPFVMQLPAPPDGNGLNPLLQNPGMIIHPPLLFIGYAGFIMPTCLALAEHLKSISLSRGEESSSATDPAWHKITRPYLLISWLFLTAGIMLGAWWAYRELGWGGYWGWDPVENSSLVPWLLATALLHTLAIERRGKSFARFNRFLILLTSISTLFATYLVRSGVIDSVHAFGQGPVGTPLLIAIVLMLCLAIGIACSEKPKGEAITDMLSLEAFLSFMSWFLIALAAIITLATLWPVLTSLVSTTRGGLDAAFYNRVCLPLATVVLVFLAFCPWLRRQAGQGGRVKLLLLVLVFLATALLLYVCTPYHDLRALFATAAACTIAFSCLFSLVRLFKTKAFAGLSAIGAHVGLALCAFGVAFSGPYSIEKDILFSENESAEVEEYLLTLKSIKQEEGPGYVALVATIAVEDESREIGLLCPERRMYEKFGDMQFSEIDTLFSLKKELYVSLLGLTADKKVLVRFSIKPFVNWLWVGGICMSLLPLFGLGALRSRDQTPCPER